MGQPPPKLTPNLGANPTHLATKEPNKVLAVALRFLSHHAPMERNGSETKPRSVLEMS